MAARSPCASRRPSWPSRPWASRSPSTTSRTARSTAPGRSTSFPRTISRKEWQKIEAGLIQRAAALNLFIDDVYHEQKFIKDGLMPASIIATSKNFRANVKRHQATARHLGAHLRLGPDPRQGRHGLRARGQPARSLRRVLHAREPPGREARVPRAVRERGDPAGGRLSLPALRHADARCRRARKRGPRSWCSRPASTTRRTSNTPTSRARWAASWSKAAISR